MVDRQIHIREADTADISLLSELIRLSYRDATDRFKLTVSNCPKHPSNYTDEWVEKDFHMVEHVFHKALELGTKSISIGIIAEQAELKQWYQKMGFIEGATKTFSHLPFRVTFMSYEL